MTRMPFKQLRIWQKAMGLADGIYTLTESFPKTEQYGLVSQMRRAAVSVVCNIAEGSQRGTDRDYSNFIAMSRGSLAELETQIFLAFRRSFFEERSMQTLIKDIDELSKMLNAFQQKLIATR